MHLISLRSDREGQLGEMDPKGRQQCQSEPPLQVLDDSCKDQAVQLLFMCWWPALRPHVPFGWWFSLWEPLWTEDN